MSPYPKFGTLIRDSVYADGNGGSLTRHEYELAKKKDSKPITDQEFEEHLKALKDTGQPSEKK